MKHSSEIASAMQGGGPETDALSPHWMGIKRAFGPDATSAFGPEIDDLTYILRVDGSLQKFGTDGIDNIRLSNKGKYISVDICIPEYRWQRRTDREIAGFIAECIMESLDVVAARLKRHKIACDKEQLRADLKRGCEKFMKLFPE